MAKDYKPPLDENGNVQFDPMRKYTVKRTGKQVMRMQMMIRVSAVIVLALFLFVLLLWLFSLFSQQAGRFTVSSKDINRGLILSETADFAETSASLSASPVEQMDNITFEWMPTNLTETDGSHNGDNYLCYTFYTKNTGEETIDYTASISIDYMKKNVDDAVRVQVYRNDSSTVYAKQAKDGTPEIDPQFETVPFVSGRIIMNETRTEFNVGDIDKYTVVVWLEGNDPECVNDILGGELKMSMSLEVVDPDDAASV